MIQKTLNKAFGWIKQYRNIIIYVISIIAIYLLKGSESAKTSIQMVLLIILWYMPFKMSLRFKAINIGVLTFFMVTISDLIFESSNMNSWVMLVVTILFVSLIINIFVVIRDLYLKNQSHNVKRFSNGVKLIYLVGSFTALIISVLLSFSVVYADLYAFNEKSFQIIDGATFNGIYYSSITYFTVGFGDITPISSIARRVSMLQMILGYAITCLIIPVLLVAIQKLIQGQNKTTLDCDMIPPK